LVVYNEKSEGNVTRRVVEGPHMFVPEASEWFHEFLWSSEDKPALGVPKAGKFTKLKTTPDSMEIEVEFVRTADDALLDLNLMVFFQLVEVPTMLDSTQDPITDITNAIASDVVLYFSKTTFLDFKQATEAINDLKTYPQSLDRSHRIGYKITKIVFKGYRASEALQRMQNEGIESRTQLLIEEEKERQNQKLLDFKLEKEQQRAQKKK